LGGAHSLRRGGRAGGERRLGKRVRADRACTAAGFNGKRRIDQRQQRSARNIGARRERSKRGREIALRRDIAPFEARADVAARRLVGTRGG